MFRTYRIAASVISAVIAVLLTPSAAAEYVDFGDYQVHYSIFASSFLRPEIAEKNGLNRSKSIGIINISIMEETGDGGLRTVSGQVEGKVLNDIQQQRFLGFRRISEGDAVYYIAEFQYRNAELLTFQVTARPQGGGSDLPIRVAHALYND
ncbi:DUF4426 domain-containing protein [Marinobacter changyiensis]|uniref:DUF4426 domain-containing protein n=1 Tax=Marinobacter changyiensis TaxID=2604091 RepID=UPI00126429F8|nr:DUF4426 domain-containing protein [Marinobacter changyiensis]